MKDRDKVLYLCTASLQNISQDLYPINKDLSDLALWLADKVLKIYEEENPQTTQHGENTIHHIPEEDILDLNEEYEKEMSENPCECGCTEDDCECELPVSPEEEEIVDEIDKIITTVRSELNGTKD